MNWKKWIKTLFPFPFWVDVLGFAACGIGLIWVFGNGYETGLPACVLYALSAWMMTAVCAKLPAAICRGKRWITDHPKAAALFRNDERRFGRSLYREQIVNSCYGVYKIAAGVLRGSAWIGCEGIYHLAQSMIQLYQILGRKRAVTLAKQWRSYRLCGVLILLLHLTLIGLVFQMINWNRAPEQGEIMVIITAFFAFYKIAGSLISLARDRKHPHPVDSSVRMLKLTQAIFAIFSLQCAMFHTFGTGEAWEQWMNVITGCSVCLLIVSTGIYMIRRGNRELKKIQETTNG